MSHIEDEMPRVRWTDGVQEGGAAVSDAMPWNIPGLEGWAIVGMNHYHVEGERRLFVAMTRRGRCIVAEGAEESMVFWKLREAAALATPSPDEQPKGASDARAQGDTLEKYIALAADHMFADEEAEEDRIADLMDPLWKAMTETQRDLMHRYNMAIYTADRATTGARAEPVAKVAIGGPGYILLPLIDVNTLPIGTFLFTTAQAATAPPEGTRAGESAIETKQAMIPDPRIPTVIHVYTKPNRYGEVIAYYACGTAECASDLLSIISMAAERARVPARGLEGEPVPNIPTDRSRVRIPCMLCHKMLREDEVEDHCANEHRLGR